MFCISSWFYRHLNYEIIPKWCLLIVLEDNFVELGCGNDDVLCVI